VVWPADVAIYVCGLTSRVETCSCLRLIVLCGVGRYVAVGSNTVPGKTYLGGVVQDFAYQSYNICCGRGDVMGDGVTPLECAIGEESPSPP
jgi:hypothetical protein